MTLGSMFHPECGPAPITRCAMTIAPSWQLLGPDLGGLSDLGACVCVCVSLSLCVCVCLHDSRSPRVGYC